MKKPFDEKTEEFVAAYLKLCHEYQMAVTYDSGSPAFEVTTYEDIKRLWGSLEVVEFEQYEVGAD